MTNRIASIPNGLVSYLGSAHPGKKVKNRSQYLPIRRKLFLLALQEVEKGSFTSAAEALSHIIKSYSYSKKNLRRVLLFPEQINSNKTYKAPRWRDLGLLNKAICYTLAMDNPWPFTMNLSDRLIEELQSVPDMGEIIKRRVSYHLESRLGDLPIWYVLEFDTKDPMTKARIPFWQAKDGRPHLHGVIGGPECDRPTAREALHAVNKNTYAPGFKGRAIRFSRPFAWVGWSEYAHKHMLATQSCFYRGLPLRVDNITRRRGKELYESCIEVDSTCWIKAHIHNILSTP